MTTGRTFDVKQAAAYLNVSPETIRRAYRAKQLRGTKDALKAGYPLWFTQEDLEAFKLSRTIQNV